MANRYNAVVRGLSQRRYSVDKTVSPRTKEQPHAVHNLRHLGIDASRHFADTSSMSDRKIYDYVIGQAGPVQKTAGRQAGDVKDRRKLLASYSHRTTEDSRRRALRHILGQYGVTFK